MKKRLFFLWSLFSSALFAQSPSKPKLVIAIVVDQMRYDYLEKYKSKFSEGGFKRLLNEGYSFSNMHYNYAPTYTGPGHASIFTGSTPSVHGIIGNDWYSRGHGKSIYCVQDSTTKCVGCEGTSGQMSPRNMISSTVGDQLKLSNGKKSIVMAVALKDRGAILPAGHLGNAAYWYNSESGNWISSTYYMNELPSWVNEFNKRELSKKYLELTWHTLFPIETYTESISDDNPYEDAFKGEEKPVFPHVLPELMKDNGGLGLIRLTPFGNSLTKDFALELIKNENLGKDEYTDLISISFSSTDYIGHRFGPQSVEVEDAYLRLDENIAEILNFLDIQTGKENYLVFLTADHAAPETPAYLKTKNIHGGYLNERAVEDSLKKHLKELYGEELVITYTNQQVYLDEKKMNEKKLNKIQIEKDACIYLLKIKGVTEVLTRNTLDTKQFKDGINHTLQNGFYPKRSGDVLVNYAPYWMAYGSKGTTHGSPYFYDTHVPLIWFGWKIKQGTSIEKEEITGIAATLSHLLKIGLPRGSTGKNLQDLRKH